MLSVVRVHLPSEIPIVGCELTPYVLLRRPDKTVSTDDVPETAPLDGHFLRYKWWLSHFALSFFLSFLLCELTAFDFRSMKEERLGLG